MSVLQRLAFPYDWARIRFGRCFDRRQDVGEPNKEPLSVYLGEGVVRRADRTDNHNELGADLGKYLVVREGDLVFNKLRTWQGGFGASQFEGIVSPAYYVCTPRSEISSRFVDYQLHSAPYLAELVRVSKWQPPSQFDTPWDQLRALPLSLPTLDEQQRIASFLDRECARIAELLDSAQSLAERLLEPVLAFFAEQTAHVPAGRIGYRFEVQLGKMLDEKRIDPTDVRPYLRNTNVQWDRLEIEDLKTMTFNAGDRRKFALRPGDLLVCEGGVVGRSAVWNGEVEDCYYQKALHRVRPRGSDSVRYLMWCLRLMSERGDFAADGTGSTILHLPAERLRATRIPLPSVADQHALVERVDARATRATAIRDNVAVLEQRLADYRNSLITEAVTGHLTGRDASERQMDERVHAALEGTSA